MDYELTYSFNERLGVWEVNLTGEIDIFNSDGFKERVLAMIQKKPAGLRIDCGGLKYLDSTGLGAFVSLYKGVKDHNGGFALCNVGSNLMRLLKITNLDELFTAEGKKKWLKTTAT